MVAFAMDILECTVGFCVGLVGVFSQTSWMSCSTCSSHRDDGLAIFNNITGPQAERKWKEIIRHFREHRLKITVQSNLKSVDYLDITLNLTNRLFQSYRKPNNGQLYIYTKSNHPPTEIKQIPAAINHRLSALSSHKETFDKAKSLYDKALKSSRLNRSVYYCKKNTTAPTKRTRSRNIIWFNPPCSKNVQTNVAKIFLNLIKKHFPPNHNLHPIFNKNNVKVRYSCMPNMGSIINNHNKKILINNNNTTPQKGCNCRKKDQCLLDNNCLITSIIYKANMATDKGNT